MNKHLRTSMLALFAFFFATTYATTADFDFTSVENLKTYGVTNPPSGKGEKADFVAFTSQGVSFSSVNGSTDQGKTIYAWSEPSSGDGVITLRVYQNGKFTISVDGTITSIAFNGNSLNQFSANIGNYSTSNGTWSGAAASVTFSAAKAVQIRTLTVTYTNSSDGPAKVRLYKKATSVEAGKSYLLVGNKNGTLQMAAPFSGNYGRISAVDATVKGEYIQTTDATNEFTFESVTGGYAIKQSNGKYIYTTFDSKNDKYYNTFNFSTTPTSGNVFTVTANTDGTFNITNTLSTYNLLYSPTHSNFEGAKDKEDEVPPYLYEFDREEVLTPEIIIKGEQEFRESTTVTIVPSAAGTQVYYTTDGTEPDELDELDEPPLYTEPFTITESCTVKAWERETGLRAEMTFTRLQAVEVESIAKMKENGDCSEVLLNLDGAKVTYVYEDTKNSAKHIYIRDNSASIDFYLSLKKDKEKAIADNFARDMDVNGTINVAYKVYNGLPEIVANDKTTLDDLMVSAGSTPAAPIECTIAEAKQKLNEYVLIKGLTPRVDSNRTYGDDQNGDNIQLFNGFYDNAVKELIESLDETKKYDVTGISQIYSSRYNEIFVLTATESTDTGIADIQAAHGKQDNRMFNLAGQQVSKNYKGVVIVDGKKLINK